MYESWKNTWNDPGLILQSNPRMFARSKQYSAVLGYCENKGKEIWPLIFNNYVDGEELNMLLIGDLTFGEYLWVMDDIKHQKTLKATNIIPSQRANYVNYIAILLGELEEEFETELKSDTYTDVLTLDKTKSINVYPNPAGNFVNIKIVGVEQTEVIIKICDLSGKLLKSVSTNIMGDYTFNISTENFPDGIYICKIESKNEVYTTKLNVMR